MPRHKESSSKNSQANYAHYLSSARIFTNKVRKLERHIKRSTQLQEVPDLLAEFDSEGNHLTKQELTCSDQCAVEALKRLLSMGTWTKLARRRN